MFILLIILLILFFLAAFIFGFFVLYKIIGYSYAYFFGGAIYVATPEEKVKQMINILDLKSVKKAIDLGSGDGRLVIALAKKGIETHGYEINPFLVSLARKNIREAGMENRAFVNLKNLWKENLGEFDVIILYGMMHMMNKLEKKLDRELKSGTMVVSNYFKFPNWKYFTKEGDIYLYIKK